MQTNSQSIINICPDSVGWNLSDQVFNGEQKVLRVPIAVKGTWKHDKYGTVSFDQNDFDQIISNWQEAKAGYDPPLFLGHPIPVTSVDGEPSEGWPETIFQSGDTLYGDYTPTSANLFTDVEAKRYRHASAEILRNAKDKVTGENLGTMLVGVAITNRPYLPLKDHTIEVIEKFSDNNTDSPFVLFTFTDSQTPTKGDIEMTNAVPVSANVETEEAKLPETPVAVTSVAPTVVPAVTTPDLSQFVPRSLYDKLASQLAEVVGKFSTLEQAFSDSRAREKAKETELKLDKLTKLNVPAHIKQTFSDMITSGSLSQEVEDKLFADYEKSSKENEQVYKFSQGAQQATVTQQVDMPERYSQQMAENAKIAEARKAARLAVQHY